MEKLQTVVAVDGDVRIVTVASASRLKLKHKVLLSCTCEGFRYGGYCRHLTEAACIVRTDAVAQRERTKQRLG
jgi:hypothetical protein